MALEFATPVAPKRMLGGLAGLLAILKCSPTLDRPAGRFSGLVKCSPTLDRPAGGFSGLGLMADGMRRSHS